MTSTRGFMKTTLKVPSETYDWDLDVWRFLPTNEEPNNDAKAEKKWPVIVMAHGWSGNKLLGLSSFAEVFAEAGYACLVFDYRRWGASDGTPRHVLNVQEQLEDYRTVINYARLQPEFDPEKVVLWGTSFSGGHAISLASETSVGVCAAIAQGPYTGVIHSLPLNMTIAFSVAFDLLKQVLGLPPTYILAAGGPNKPAALMFEGSEEGMLDLCANAGDWPNQVSARSMIQLLFYKPHKKAATIRCPVLLVAPEDDILCPVEGCDMVSRAAPQKVELLRLPDSGHFDIYPGKRDYRKGIEAQLQFLKKHVPETR